MSSKTAVSGRAAAGSSSPLFMLGLIFWLVVHYAVPLGTTWGGVSAHEAAYIVLIVTVLIPLVIIAVIWVIVLLLFLLAA